MRRILYIGQLANFSTCLARMHALEELGCVTIPFDTSPYTGYPQRILRTAAHRLNAGPPVREMNRDVTRFIKANAAGVTHVWIDKGKWLCPETVKMIKHVTGAPIVHYTPDSQILYNRSRLFSESIPLYDQLFTTKTFEVVLYKNLGAKRVHFINQGYDGDKLFPRDLGSEEKRRFGSDIVFVGRCEPHYVRCLKAAFSVEGRHRVWGPGWRRYKMIHPWVREAFTGDSVWGDDYASAISGASIALCFLTKRCPERTTTRTFEIPACGTFMLAERSEDHLALYEEGKEAEFFGGYEELIDKARYYLGHPAERQRIAAAGYERSQKSGYDNFSRMKEMLQVVDGLYVSTAREGS